MRLQIETSGFAEAVAAMKKAPRTIQDLNERSALRAGSRGVSRIKREYRGETETTDTATAVRTGALRRNYDAATHRDGSTVVMEMGLIKSGVDAKILRYAAVHEKDGYTVIRSRSGKYLAIPLSAAKTASGVARGGPRDYPNTFFLKGRKPDSPIIAQRIGQQVVPLFVLKRSVRVKGRPALQPVSRQYVIPEIEAAIEKNFAAGIEGGSAA